MYSVNLAFALGMLRNPSSTATRLRVGILDLDIFGPSIPTLMGLQNSPEPELTACVFVLSYFTAPLYVHHPSYNFYYVWMLIAFPSWRHQASDESRGSVYVYGVSASACGRPWGHSNSMAWINGTKSCSTTTLWCRLDRRQGGGRVRRISDWHAARNRRCTINSRSTRTSRWYGMAIITTIF